MSASANRRSFLGWTAAIAGCALLTRPALEYGFTSYYSEFPGLLIVPPKPRVLREVPIVLHSDYHFGDIRWVGQVFFPFNGAPPTDEEIEAAIAETM